MSMYNECIIYMKNILEEYVLGLSWVNKVVGAYESHVSHVLKGDSLSQAVF